MLWLTFTQRTLTFPSGNQKPCLILPPLCLLNSSVCLNLYCPALVGSASPPSPRLDWHQCPPVSSCLCSLTTPSPSVYFLFCGISDIKEKNKSETKVPQVFIHELASGTQLLLFLFQQSSKGVERRVSFLE